MSEIDSRVIKLVTKGVVSDGVVVDPELKVLAQTVLERVLSGEVVGMAVAFVLSDGETSNGYYAPLVSPLIGELRVIETELIQHKLQD
jgi:hypothetical protein